MRWNPFRALPSFLGGVVGGVAAVVMIGASPHASDSLKVTTIDADQIHAHSISVDAPSDPDRKGGSTHLRPEGLLVERGRGLYVATVGANGIALAVVKGNKLQTGDNRIALFADDLAGGIRLNDGSGHLRVAVGPNYLKPKDGTEEILTSPGSITLFDEFGKVVWQSPR
jgi:hypothetical protein